MISFKSYLTLSSFICILTLVQTQPLFFDLSVPETQWQSPNTELIVPNLQNFQEQFLQQFQQQIEQHQMLVGNVLQQQEQEQQQQLQERLLQQQQQQQQQQLQQQQELERQQQELQRQQQLVQQQQQQQQREQQLQRREQELQQQQQRQQQLREQLQQQQQQLLEQQQQLQQQREEQQQQQQREQILLQQPQQLLQLQQPPKLQLQQPQQLPQQKPQPPSSTNNVETKFWRNAPNGGLIEQRQVTLKTVPNPQILLPQYPPLLQMQTLLPKNILQQQQQPASTLNGETTNWDNTPNGGVLTNHISHYHVFSYRSQTSDATPTISPQTTTACNSCCDAKNALCSTCCFGGEPALGGPALKASAG